MITCLISSQVRSDDIKSVVAKRMQASKANKVMASIMPEFANFQVRAARAPLVQSEMFFNCGCRRRAHGCSRGNDVTRDAIANQCQVLRPHVVQLQLLPRRSPWAARG